jgi:hypothetical protein
LRSEFDQMSGSRTRIASVTATTYNVGFIQGSK